MICQLLQAAQQVLEAWDNAVLLAHDDLIQDRMDSLRTALEQQQAEPVAWTTMPEAEDWCFVSGGKDPTSKLEGKWFPLYTTPPQRKPLTDDEISLLYMRHTGRPRRTYWEFARAIEAAHGIGEKP